MVIKGFKLKVNVNRFLSKVCSTISRVIGFLSKLILEDCDVKGSDVPCFKKVSKWMCIKYGIKLKRENKVLHL